MKITVSSILFSLKPTALGRFFVGFLKANLLAERPGSTRHPARFGLTPAEKSRGAAKHHERPSDNRDSNFGVTSLNLKVTGSS